MKGKNYTTIRKKTVKEVTKLKNNTEVNIRTFIVGVFFVGMLFQNTQAQTLVATISQEEVEAFWHSFKTFSLCKDVANITHFVADTLWVYNQEDSVITKEYFTTKQVKKDMRKSGKKTMELVPRFGCIAIKHGNENVVVTSGDNFTTQFNINEYAPEREPEYATRSVEFKVNPECANEYIYSTVYRLDTFENSIIYYFKKIDGQIKLYKKLDKIIQ